MLTMLLKTVLTIWCGVVLLGFGLVAGVSMTCAVSEARRALRRPPC